MSAHALKFGLERFIGKHRPQGSLHNALQHFMKHLTGTPNDAPAPLAGRRVVLGHGAHSLADTLRLAGAAVVRVPHGGSLIEQLRAHDGADAVILALQASGHEGLAAASAIRASGEPWAGLAVLALAPHSEAFAEAAAAAGIDGLLAKPVEKTLLYETLARFISAGATRAPRVPAAAPAASTSVIAEGLLNLSRLDSYHRLGMLEELVGDYLPEMKRLMGVLQEAVRNADLKGSLAALHSLLGMSGEAGAQALYQQVRKIYVPLLEDARWPAGEDWLPQLRQLAVRTEEGLKAYCAQQARSSAT